MGQPRPLFDYFCFFPNTKVTEKTAVFELGSLEYMASTLTTRPSPRTKPERSLGEKIPIIKFIKFKRSLA